MRRAKNLILDIFKKGDMLLLALAVLASIFGTVMVYAAMAGEDSSRNITIQIGCTIAGVLIYLIFTIFDIEILAGQRTLLFLFNVGFILLLLVWGVKGDTVNLSWLDLPFLPFNIQPAEVCKIFYTIILAKTMSVNQTRISSLRSVTPLTFHMLVMVGLIVVISGDMGVALIFVFIFLAMAYTGGVSGWWFLGGAGVVGIVAPTMWQYVLRDDQKNRILALLDPSLDPTGQNELWQTNKNLNALRNGGLTGMGLFNGKITSADTLPADHTDSIFSTIGEQLGIIGCIITLLLLLAIVIRIIYVGMKSPDYMNRLICIGVASMFFFQILINIGVCLGLLPVIGLVLPFFSYGGSAMLTNFMALGFVSSIKRKPARDTSAHYIRPY